MSATGMPPGTAADASTSFVQWPAVIAGAIAAAGISFTLLAFGAGIGLSVASTAPTWRDSSPWLWIISGLFLILVALCAFGFGGYIAGRMRASFRAPAVSDNRSPTLPETEFRDGVHGIVMWGLAILITALLGLASAAALMPMVAPSGGAAGPGAATTGENIIATEIDTLLRTTRNINDPSISYRRAEVSRILMKANSNRIGITSDERNYLAQIVQDRTGMGIADSAARTERVIGAAAQELHRARVAAVLQAFMVAAGLLLGAAVAWYAAVEGGRDRQRGTLPVWDWRFRQASAHHHG